jgi:hypothetical protein
LNTDPIWTVSDQRDLKYWVSWSFKDPENCIVGLQNTWGNNFYYRYITQYYEIPAKWYISKDGENTLLTAEIEIPISLLLSMPNQNLDGMNLNMSPLSQNFGAFTSVKIRQGSGFRQEFIRAEYGLTQVWGNWFSKVQGLQPKNCEPSSSQEELPETKFQYTSKIIESGVKPKIEITIQEPTNCIFLVHSAPLIAHKNLNSCPQCYNYGLTLAEYPFWHGEAAAYFNSIVSQPNQIIQVVSGLQTDTDVKKDLLGLSNVFKVTKIPNVTLSHVDSVVKEGNVTRIISTIDASSFSSTSTESVSVHLGVYRWHSRKAAFVGAGWRVTSSGGTWTARYSPGGSLPGGWYPSYFTKVLTFSVSDLVTTAAEKAAAEKKTIKCVKGKLTKKVTAIKPVCPKGYKKTKP